MSRASIFIICLCFISCEDIIDVELAEGTAQVTVDAFITNEPKDQFIRLSWTQPYFTREGMDVIEDAQIVLTDELGKGDTFYYTTDGYYKWRYIDKPLVYADTYYHLDIITEGNHFHALQMANPSVPVDSIQLIDLAKSDGFPGFTKGIIAEMWAVDRAGTNDFYWIKSYRDGIHNPDVEAIILSHNGAFGTEYDGFPFVPPVRLGISNFEKPYIIGEVLRVEILGISEETFNFLDQVSIQSTNGGLFADPPHNVITNIENTSESKDIEDQPVGWFSVAMVESLEMSIYQPE